MDGSVKPLQDRGLIPAATPRPRTKRDQQGRDFDLSPFERPSSSSVDKEEERKGEDRLPVGQAPYTEAGKRLDVTA